VDPSNPAFSVQIATAARELKQGDLAALGRLYDLTAGRLMRYAESLTHQFTDAEDALQGAMVRIAGRPELLAQADLPWAYFIRIVRNEALKIVARRKPEQAVDVQSAEGWASQESTVERIAEHEESVASVRKALQRLPAEQAEVVVLKIWEGMTFAEIAVVTGESANTVASRYRYALQKLSRSLESIAGEVTYD